LQTPALLALQDGTVFHGISIGCDGVTTGEIVFNTAMTGYQEILTDPSYCKQIVTFTYPHIGNVGTNIEDLESEKVWASGLVIKHLSLVASNWRNQLSLSDYLKQQSVVAIADIDTRKLTRIIRDKGAQNACIIAGEKVAGEKVAGEKVAEKIATGDYVYSNTAIQEAINQAKAFPGLLGLDLAKEVSTQSPYEWNQGSINIIASEKAKADNVTRPAYHIVTYDFGVKKNILRLLVDRGCRVTVVPAQTDAEHVLALQPDAVFLSNGPGDPEPCGYAQTAIKVLLEKGLPVFGICLGHQILALACGAKTIKMKFGHHGANHPVQNIKTSEVHITSQNHGFAVDEKTLPAQLIATHRSLFDHSLQGIAHTAFPAMGFQGHPEASPGPNDIVNLFDSFMQLIDENVNNTTTRK